MDYILPGCKGLFFIITDSEIILLHKHSAACPERERESERHREKHRRLECLTGLTRELQHPPQQTNATVSSFKEQFTLRAYKFSVRASNSSTEEISRK
jgi:hypothetical protein